MDGRRFDEWAKVVAVGFPRRRILQAIGAALFGGGLLRVAGITTAQADAGCCICGTNTTCTAEKSEADCVKTCGAAAAIFDPTLTCDAGFCRPLASVVGCCRCGGTAGCQAQNREQCERRCGKDKTRFDPFTVCQDDVCLLKTKYVSRPGFYRCCSCPYDPAKGCVNVFSGPDCDAFCGEGATSQTGAQLCARNVNGAYTCGDKPRSHDDTGVAEPDHATPELGTPVSDDGTTDEVSQAEYQTCDAACRKPKRKDQVRPYLVSCLTNKPCTDTGCGCHLYRKAKEKDAKWEHYADQGVEKGLDDDAYSYECRCVRAMSAQTTGAVCEPIASEFALQRQLVGLVDAAPRPEDTRRDGFVRLDGTVTVSPDDAPGWAAAGLGWAGAYTATLITVSGTAKRLLVGRPGREATRLAGHMAFARTTSVVDATAADTRLTFDAHVLECLPPAGRRLVDLAALVPSTASPDTKATPVGDESSAFRWKATGDDGRTWQHFATVGRVGNIVFTLDSAFTGTAKAGRSLNERVAPAIVARLPIASDDPASFASSRFASTRLVFPTGTRKLALAGIGYGGSYVRAATDTPEVVTFNQTKFAAADNAILAFDRWSRDSDFYVEIVRSTSVDAARTGVAGRRNLYDLLAQGGNAVETRPGADDADWTFHAAILPQGQGFTGSMASISRVDDLERESGLIVPNIDVRPNESPFASLERFLGADYDRFFDYSTRQYACLAAGEAFERCRLFGDDDTSPAREEEPPQTGSDDAAKATGPNGIVNIPGLLLYPVDYGNIPTEHGVLQGTYFPSIDPIAALFPDFSVTFSLVDAAFLSVGSRTPTGEVTLFGKNGAGWTLRPDDSLRVFEDARNSLAPFATQTFSGTGAFGDRPYWGGFLPNARLGPDLPEADVTVGLAPAGTLVLFGARTGRSAENVEADLGLMLNRALSDEIPGHNLGRHILHLEGEFAAPIVSRYYTRLNGQPVSIAGQTDEARERLAKRSEGQHCVLHQDQEFVTGREDASFSTAIDLRLFERRNGADTFMTDYPQGIQEDFGVDLRTITEGQDLPGSLGSRFYIFERQRADGMLEAALLGTALVETAAGDSVVAVTRVGAVVEPSATDFIGWFTREGWLPTATGGIILMEHQIKLLNATYEEAYRDPGWGKVAPEQFLYRF